MKSMHLGEKTGHQPTHRDKPSNLGEKTEDMPTQRDKPSNLGVLRRQQHENMTECLAADLLYSNEVT
ncbi:hypothetical protein TNCV_4627121 [Trichonephila clavipes]|nr:hypothetical protein TNCV_4627121 [Trichonephila clavipes]